MAERSDYLDMLSRVSNVQWTRWRGAAEVRRAQRARLHSLVAYARTHSPLYAELYRDVPQTEPPLEALPVVNKRQLMDRFDEWVTDRAITSERMRAFCHDPSRIGHAFLDRYAVWQSSGTTGEPAAFVQDADALAIYNALLAAQLQQPESAAAYAFGLVAHGGRAALIVATGGHYASIVAWRRLAQSARTVDTLELSVLDPVAAWVDALNAFQPGFVAGYPTVLQLLAAEQVARRLRITPAIVWCGGEHLPERTRRDIERAFGCLVINEYGSSECLSVAFGCNSGWLHVSADWVIVEAVDRDLRPVEPETLSHTALITNLANRVQPVIRYDIGDRIIVKGGPCECGNLLPAIRVEGRRDDVVTLRRADGSMVDVLPMVLTTAIEERSPARMFQIVQHDNGALSLRLPGNDARQRRADWRAARAALVEALARHGVTDVDISLDRAPPSVDAASGKLRQVVSTTTKNGAHPRARAERTRPRVGS